MRDYKITPEGKTYQLAENADDLNIVRYSQLKNIITEESSGMKIPDIIEWFASRRQFYNQSDLHSLLTSEINMAKQVEENSDKIFNDASHKIFALMCLEEGEDASVYDSTKQDEKLKRMALEGLTQGEVFSVTSNFIQASPQLLASYFLMSLVALEKVLKSSIPLLERTEEALSQVESKTV